jgi:putative sigma-54 modulation protein
MNINIKATKVKLTPQIKDYIQEKIDSLEKYLGSVKCINCDLEIGMAVGGQGKGDIYRAELNLEVPRELLRVEKTEPDLFKAIDKVKDHMARSIKRYKTKLEDKRRTPKKG